jgi:hypothetical protein
MRVLGPKPLPKRKRPGMYQRIRTTFVAHMRKDRLIGVDMFPVQQFLHSMMPEELRDVDEVTMRINLQTGEMDVSQIPATCRHTDMLELMAAIDRVAEIYPGQMLLENAEVTSVAGNEVKIRV